METSMVKDLITKDLWAGNSYLPDSLPSEQTGDVGGHLTRRFWEIEGFFKCPVIGACLDITEQKQLIKKEKISVKKMSLFEIHETLVHSSESANSLSRRIDLI